MEKRRKSASAKRSNTLSLPGGITCLISQENKPELYTVIIYDAGGAEVMRRNQVVGHMTSKEVAEALGLGYLQGYRDGRQKLYDQARLHFCQDDEGAC